MNALDRLRRASISDLLLLASLSLPLTAAEFTYQGRLADAGAAVSGSFDLRFRLFDSEFAGSQLGSTICRDQVAVENGLFTTSLDFDFAIFDGQPLWLEIAVRADSVAENCAAGAFTLLSPRQRLTSAPYAISAQTVHLPFELTANIGGLSNNHVARFINTNIDGTALRLETSNAASVGSAALWCQSAGLGGRAVYGLASDNLGGGAANYGVWGQSAGPSGRGVYGYATHISGANYGVRGRSDSSVGWAGYFEGRGHFSGRVGIGTTTPGYPLHVQGSDQFMQRIISTNVNGTWLDLHNASTGGNVWSILSTGSANGEGAGDLVIRNPTFLALDIDQNGFVGFGDITPTFRIELPNTADNGGRGRANAWTTYSSRRWKHNIQPLDDALDKVLRLRGVKFDWNADHGGAADIGFVAEEVGAVLPEIVSWEANGTDAQSLAYDRITALAIEAIKQQQRQIEEQATELRRLRDEVSELRRSMQLHPAK